MEEGAVMTVLYVNLLLVTMFALMARFYSVELINGSLTIKPNKLFTLLALITLVCVSGLRSNIGDTFFYMHAYKINRVDWAYIFDNKDIGFGIMQMLLQQITMDPQLLIFVISFITNCLIVMVLYKYCRLIELGLYVFITSGLFLTSMNGLRQFLAAAVLFAGTKYLIEGNGKKYGCVVLLASSIHMSAIIMVPIYFIVRSKAWSKTTFLLLFSSIILVLGFNQFQEFLFSALESTQYGHYQDFSEGGASILRVLVTSVPILLAFMGRERLKEIFPEGDAIINMSILGVVFMLVSTQNWIFARFYYYFGLYQLILIPWVVQSFRERDRKLLYLCIVIFYSIFFYNFWSHYSRSNKIRLHITFNSIYNNFTPTILYFF